MKRLDVFKCEKCGSIVEVLRIGGGTLTCCDAPMIKLVENTSEGAKEKHIPVFIDGKIKVGSVDHPMDPDHYIEWIEASDENSKWYGIEFLEPGQPPEVAFGEGWANSSRAYCNKHGLWKGSK